MKNRLNTAVRVLAAAASMAMATGASAQSAGTWMVKAGVNKITPHVDSGDISAPALPGTKANVEADTKPILSFAYMLTDNISAEMILGVPYKHD
ncbi:MAG: OmpW family outer membrane protein, partial [Janthinobacterium sp.]